MDLNGLLVIDKPPTLTSHDVIDQIRRKLSIRRAGHLGTLDPMATGVLPVCVGKATRLAQFIPASPKEYTGRIRFGFSTDTYDREGTPTTEERPLRSDQAEIRQAMTRLTGRLEQVPPPFSAKKIRGVRAYKLARKGQAINNKPVQIEVFQFAMTRLEASCMDFHVLCSPGTYVRSLAHDLGQILACGAHLTELRRTRSGEFTIGMAIPPDRVTPHSITPPEELMPWFPRVEVSETQERNLHHGHPIACETGPGFARIFNKKGKFLAVGAVENGWVRPRVMLTSTTLDE